jgi:hypothetical protein
VVSADLVAFLLARIVEDQDPDWHTVECGVGLGYWATETCVCGYPARVLVECDAKRRIVEEARDQFAKPGDDPDDGMADLTYENVLSLLALPYADHPDYDERWRP